MADTTTDTTVNSVSVSSDGNIHEDETAGLRDLLENLRLSGTFLPRSTHLYLLRTDVPNGTITWKRKTVEEAVTIATGPDHSGNSNIHRRFQRDRTPSLTQSEAKSSASTTSSPKRRSSRSHRDPYGSNPLVPPPHKIKLPSPGDHPEGFWVITVGQEVGIFFHW